MNKNQITIIEEIKTFQYVKKNGTACNTEIKRLLNGNEEMRDYSFETLIGIRNKDEEIIIGIYGQFPDVLIRRIYWENFNYDEIKVLSEIFKLYFNNNSNYPSASLESEESKLMATLAIKKSHSSNNYFLVIYHFDDGESRRSPQLYVHGIWKVELSEEFARTINMKS